MSECEIRWEKMNIQQGSWLRCELKTAKKCWIEARRGFAMATIKFILPRQRRKNKNLYNIFKCHKTISFLTTMKPCFSLEIDLWLSEHLPFSSSLVFGEGDFNNLQFITTLSGFIVIWINFKGKSVKFGIILKHLFFIILIHQAIS